MRSSVSGLEIFCIEGGFELGALVIGFRRGILNFLTHGPSVPSEPVRHVQGRCRLIGGGHFEHRLALTRIATPLSEVGKGDGSEAMVLAALVSGEPLPFVTVVISQGRSQVWVVQTGLKWR